MTSVDATSLARVLAALDRASLLPSGASWDAERIMALCPAHDDRSPSLSVTHTGDRTLVHCFAGCNPADVLDRLGLELGDLFDDWNGHRTRTAASDEELEDEQRDQDYVERRAARRAVESVKPRPKGSLPYLPDDRGVEALREWLTRAFRPPAEWRLDRFERSGNDRDEPCALTFTDAAAAVHRYRIREQGDLMTRPRLTLLTVSNGTLWVPHLTPTEAEDVWAALCAFGDALEDPDEPEQAREWLRLLLAAADVVDGRSLAAADSRYDALMTFRNRGEFTRLDALSVIRNPDLPWPRLPVCLQDQHSGEFWVRAGEARTFLLYIVGVQPLKHGTLKARWHEIGVEHRYFQDRRAPHPKANVYRVPKGWLTT